MVVLLITYDVYHLINGIVLEAHLSSTDVLRHVNAGAIATEQQLLVETFVGEVSPNGIILMTLKETLSEAFLDFCLSFQIGL